LGVGLYYLFGVPGVIIGFSVPYLVFSYRFFIAVVPSMRAMFHDAKNSFRTIAKMKRFIGHSYSFSMSNAFLMYFDKLLIAPLFGYAILGHYQLAIQFLLFMGMIPLSFYQYLLSEESSGSKKGKVRLMSYLLSVGLAVTLFFASPFIVNNYFPNFVESLDAVRIASFGIVPLMIVLVLNSRFFSEERTEYVLYGSIIYLSTQIPLLFILGRSLEAAGLAAAVDIALAAQAVFLLIAEKRVHHMLKVVKKSASTADDAHKNGLNADDAFEKS
jgi:O-antigen/teichoic acid export membrane protein